MSFLKKSGKFLVYPVTIPVHYINKMIVFPVMIGKKIIKDNYFILKETLTKIHKNKDSIFKETEDKQALDLMEKMEDDSTVFLNEWGIYTDEELQKVKKGLLFEMFFYVLLAFLIVFNVFVFNVFVSFNYLSFIFIVSLFPALLLAIYAKLWRYTCLKKERFTPFFKWGFFILN